MGTYSGRRRFYIFFRPVFNIADSSITIGVFILIIFQGKIFRKNKPTESETLQIEEDENLNTESDSSNPIWPLENRN